MSPTASVFAGPQGGPLRRRNFQKCWRRALDAAGVDHVHFHDLRPTGNTLTAQAGATMSDLTARMGHTSARAAHSEGTPAGALYGSTGLWRCDALGLA